MSRAWKVASVLGLVTGVLSVVSLLRQFWDFGPVPPIQLMLEYYQQFLHAVLGWADAPLRTLVHHLQERINVRMNLSPGWKHVFLLMWLYFFSGREN